MKKRKLLQTGKLVSEIGLGCMSFAGFYGSTDENHPYVKILNDYKREGKIYYCGGKILEYKMPPHYDFKDYRLTPEETKKHFRINGWEKVIGFQNPFISSSL